MIEPIEDMPKGTVGFRATGHVTADDYRDVRAADAAAAEAGACSSSRARTSRSSSRRAVQDTKAGVTLGVGHPHAWRKAAIVTDVEWIAKASHMFAWMVPGELMVRGLDGLEDAKAWLSS